MKSARLYLTLSIALALVGFLLSAFLAMQSLSGDAVAGCGGDGGCAQVLTSRWSRLGPVPVSALGVLTYLAVLLGLGARLGSKGYSPLGDRLLWAAPPLLLVAAIWFTGVQLVAIGAVCRFCMASHVVGFALACLVLFGVMRTTIINPKPPLLVGMLMAGLFLVLQTALPVGDLLTHRAPNPFVDQDGDTWIDDARYVSLFGGELQFVLQDVPYIGDPNAEQVVAVLFDYACPHCRTLHDLLGQAIADAPGRFVLVPIPLTIAEDHNPFVSSPDSRFEGSFERALLSMAVGAVDPQKWKQFDAFLWNRDEAGRFPSDLKQARAKAEALIGQAALAEQLTGDRFAAHEAALQRNIALLGLLAEDKRLIPVTTTPGAPEYLAGQWTDLAVLYELLQSARR